MRFIAFILLIVTLFVSTFVDCSRNYTEEEIVEIQETFQSFNNNENIAFLGYDCIWLYDKTIYFDDIEYQGATIDDVIACGDEYFYAITNRVRQSTGYYELKILGVSYETLEIKEIGTMSNLLKDHTSAWASDYDKIYIGDIDGYYAFNLDTGEQESNIYQFSIRVWDEYEKYKYKIKENAIAVTKKETGEIKSILWNDLSILEEGKYLQQFSNRFLFGNARFYECEEKNGIIYLLCIIPFDRGAHDCQAVIFTYDFDTETIEYYSSLPIEIIHSVNLYIVKR